MAADLPPISLGLMVVALLATWRLWVAPPALMRRDKAFMVLGGIQAAAYAYSLLWAKNQRDGPALPLVFATVLPVAIMVL